MQEPKTRGLVYKMCKRTDLSLYAKIHANVYILKNVYGEKVFSATYGSKQTPRFLVTENRSTADIWKAKQFLPLAILKGKDLDVYWCSLNTNFINYTAFTRGAFNIIPDLVHKSVINCFTSSQWCHNNQKF